MVIYYQELLAHITELLAHIKELLAHQKFGSGEAYQG